MSLVMVIDFRETLEIEKYSVDFQVLSVVYVRGLSSFNRRQRSRHLVLSTRLVMGRVEIDGQNVVHSALANPCRWLPILKRHEGEGLAVADLDHEAVWIVEEELLHRDSSLLHRPLHEIYPQLPQSQLHLLHALALRVCPQKNLMITKKKRRGCGEKLTLPGRKCDHLLG